MKVVFMGTPLFAAPALEILSELGEEIVAVYTRRPKPGGRRGLETTKSPVQTLAESCGFRLETPVNLRTPEALQTLRDLSADIFIVAAFGLILPPEALAAARIGCFNLHASLLPRWRGAAPVQRAILAQDESTGVSIMRMEPGLDTGPIAGEVKIDIDSHETAEELTARLALLGAQTLKEHWSELSAEALEFRPQAIAGVTYAHRIEKAEAVIDWSADARAVKAKIHAFSPFPGAYSVVRRAGQELRLKLLRANVQPFGGTPGQILDNQLTIACGADAVRVLVAQRAGKSPVTGVELMRSGLLQIGDVLQPQAPFSI